ncbi:hypothetical protein MSG28_007828 [Choristoneura fumiferana]|uniref:Uncharacterized protein n=1 Tax=Choristoneura fumiferana TaxID=7141 RepID=A0ACC0J8Z0_CHOFU|nr:hypothetical protein MSG28_007828 [Choristoneura fumiferana]
MMARGGTRRALTLLVLTLALRAAAREQPLCRAHTDCLYQDSNFARENFFKVNGRTLNIIYDENTSVFSVRCDQGDENEPGPVAAADERALPALPALTDVAFAEFQGCRAPAGSYADALHALNVTVVAKLWLQYLPAESRLTRAQLAGLGALRELKLSGSTPESPLRPTPDFLAELPQLKILRLYLVEAPHALPTLPATLELLELKETALPAAERVLGGAAAGPHWLARLRALRWLTLIDEYSEGVLAPPPLGELPLLEEASLQVPLAPLPARWLAGSGLRKLSLMSCGLSDLNSFPFEGATNLTALNVSQNNLTDLPNPVTVVCSTEAECSCCVAVSSELPLTLRRLELRRTRATRLCSDWLRDARDLALIDLRDNLIDSLDYSELVMERSSELAGAGGAGVRLLLDGNPLPALQVTPHQLAACRDHAREDTLECTCDNSRLRALLRDCNKLLALAADAPCSSGGNGSFLQRDPDQLLCDYLDCPEGCSCGTRLRDNATVAQCAGAGARWPGWAAASAARPLALLAPAAGLTTVPPYRLVELIVPNNSIAALDLDDIPDTLRELDLRDNRIARVSEAAAARLRDVRVRLAGNPFACDCRDQLALARLRDANVSARRHAGRSRAALPHSHSRSDCPQVSDWDELRCGSGALRGLALSELRPGDLCGGALSWQLGAAAAAAALALLAGAGVALWPRVRPRIKQLLFERQLCLEWVLGASDEVADPGKTHDAFVSYAHQDHALAARVVRGLEARGYSTLEHCRDWHPGAAVSEHIARSVECARRTLLLVSDHYGESKWALEEFRIAHAHALERRSARVLLLRGGLRAPERLPRDLQLHLCLHTYLDLHDLDDPVFWRKLCQAMPPLGGGKPPVGGGKPPAPAPAPLGGGKLPRLTAPPEAHEAAERLGRLLSPPPPAREAPPDRSVDTLNGIASRFTGRTLNIIYDESTSVFSVRCNEGDPGEPGPVLAADERALPALPALTDVAFAEFQGCRAPAGSYADALRALNVNVVAKLWLQYLPAESRLTRAQLAGLGALRELKLSGSTPESPLRPTPDFLAELPQLKILRLYLVEAPHALPTLPATLELLELKETALPAAERALGGAAAGLHWLLRLHALRRLTLFDQYTDDRLAPPPLAALHMLEEASLRVPLAPLPARWLAGSGLRKLSLSSCGLSDLNSFPFEGATNLRTLYVSENNLTVLPIRVFGSLPALEFLDVSNNELTDAALVRALYGAPLAGAGVRLLLDGNTLPTLQVAPHQLAACRDHAREDTVTRIRMLLTDNTEYRARVELSLSELECTCDNSRLRALLRDCNKLLALAADAPCSSGGHGSFLQRDPDQLLCDYLDCPEGCSCGTRLRDNATVAQCAGAGARWPGWAAASAARPLALLAPAAGLTTVPPYRLVELIVPNNSIAALDLDDIPDTLRELDLRDNRIARVSEAAAARLRDVRVRLAGNPFACDCRDQLALARLRDANVSARGHAGRSRAALPHSHSRSDCPQVSDWDELRCGSGALRGLALSELRPGDLCGGALSWQLGAAAAAAALALLAGAGVALWPRVRPRIKQLLFERQLCLEWVLGASDEVADPGKTHDAFVSYAHQDHALAARVVRGLEARGYSTLEHCRDWHPGAAVSEHIARSVECARRTLLLVSDHYGESKWALEEFRIAHAHALERRSARVLLLRGGLRAPERLPRDLQLHLCLHTYLDLHDLDDPVFWRKLCQAMPPLGGGKPPVGGGKPPAPAPLGGGKLPRLTAPPEAHEAAERLGRLLSPPPPAREAPPDRSVDTLNGTAER